jgi:hypothetical protein
MASESPVTDRRQDVLPGHYRAPCDDRLGTPRCTGVGQRRSVWRRVTLFVHETHRVVGREADRFEELFRDGWAAALATTSDARLLWFLHQAHGTGGSYTFVTITAAASPAALDDLARRVREGDLRAWAVEADSLRHESTAKVLEPAPFSPLTEVDLGAVPAASSTVAPDGSLPLFMEDTAWPHRGRFDDYLQRAGTLYVETLRKAADRGPSLLELVAAFTPRFGSGRHREVVLWQRVTRSDLLVPLLTREIPPAYRASGTWMHDALDVRDQWESRLLRVAAWSPLA